MVIGDAVFFATVLTKRRAMKISSNGGSGRDLRSKMVQMMTPHLNFPFSSQSKLFGGFSPAHWRTEVNGGV